MNAITTASNLLVNGIKVIETAAAVEGLSVIHARALASSTAPLRFLLEAGQFDEQTASTEGEGIIRACLAVLDTIPPEDPLAEVVGRYSALMASLLEHLPVKEAS